jgi:hypothetical protein
VDRHAAAPKTCDCDCQSAHRWAGAWASGWALIGGRHIQHEPHTPSALIVAVAAAVAHPKARAKPTHSPFPAVCMSADLGVADHGPEAGKAAHAAAHDGGVLRPGQRGQHAIKQRFQLFSQKL